MLQHVLTSQSLQLTCLRLLVLRRQALYIMSSDMHWTPYLIKALISFILQVAMIQDITAIFGLQYLTMMLLKPFQKKESSIRMLQVLIVKIFLRETERWMLNRCM